MCNHKNGPSVGSRHYQATHACLRISNLLAFAFQLEELKSLHTEALQKLKRARASPTASDRHLHLYGTEVLCIGCFCSSHCHFIWAKVGETAFIGGWPCFRRCSCGIEGAQVECSCSCAAALHNYSGQCIPVSALALAVEAENQGAGTQERAHGVCVIHTQSPYSAPHGQYLLHQHSFFQDLDHYGMASGTSQKDEVTTYVLLALQY